MSDAQWEEAFQLSEAAAKLPAPERRAFVEASRAAPEVIAEVLAMLADQATGDAGSATPGDVLDEANAESAPRWRHLGKRIGRYEVVDQLGRGGMGEVYTGRDLELNRDVALKFLAIESSVDDRTAERFVREARAASALNHPNIVTVHDVVRASGLIAIVMELIEGESLRQLCRRTNPLDRVAQWGGQIANALAAAHSGGIVHRDIKPENIMLRADGFIKVLDFGLARRFDASAPSSATGTAGTFRYMSPEQTRGLPLDAATDIFSFGIVLYELATARHPFDSESPFETAHFIATKEPEAPSRHNRALPKAFDDLLAAMLHKNPTQRPRAAEVASSLTALASAPAPPATRSSSLPLAAGLALATLAGAGIWFYNSRPTPPSQILSTSNQMLYGVPLTGLPGTESDPAFSPDGLSIAYAWRQQKSGPQNIYVKRIGEGEPMRFSQGPAADSQPHWSPDGKRLAFLRDTPTDVKLMVVAVDAPANSTPQIVATLTAFESYFSRLAWSPDGASLVVADEPPGSSFNTRIYRVDLANGHRTSLTTPPSQPTPAIDSSPLWSPDGKYLAFLRSRSRARQEILLLGPEGTETRVSGPELQTIESFAWGANSREIVYVAEIKGRNAFWRSSWGPNEAPNQSPTARHPVSAGFAVEASPSRIAISPKHSKLAFVLRHRDSNVWKFDLGGKLPPRKLTVPSSEDEDLALSPDASQFVFLSKRSGAYELWAGDTNGANQRPLTDIATFSGSPAWSPDGRHIAFDARLGGLSEIWIVPASGGRPRRLLDSPVEAIMPHWSHDGAYVYFCSHASGGDEVWKAALAGGKPQRVTRQGGCNSRESPDGRFLYYIKPGNSALWRMPLDGGGEEIVPELERQDTYRYWEVHSNEIYFVGETPQPILRVLDLHTRRIRDLLTLPAPPNVGGRGLAVSPDGKFALYAQYDKYGQEIVVVDYPKP